MPIDDIDAAPYVLPDGSRLTVAQLVAADGPTYRAARYAPRDAASSDSGTP